MRIGLVITSALLVAAYSSPVYALGGTKSFVAADGTTWTAQSKVIGRTSTATDRPIRDPNVTSGGGDPIYLAPNSAGYSGVVGLLMTQADGFDFTCSGTLVGNRSVVTAAHCVSNGGGIKTPGIVRTQVFFQDDASSARDDEVFGFVAGKIPDGVTMIDVSNYAVAPGYVGEPVDQNDIAVLTLAEVAPAYAQRYELYTENLTGKQFDVTGYGVRSSAGGEQGENATNGYRRRGSNVYDFAWGDKAFDGFFTDQSPSDLWYLGAAEREYSFVADFDNGSAAQNTSCLFVQQVAGIGAAEADGLGFCSLGVGNSEAAISGGDSGGGAFVDGRLASVNSYALAARNIGDIDKVVNSTFGEWSGYVPIFIHADFIRNAIAAVPEPATWTQMLLGFGLIGVATRRRPRRVATA